MRILALSILGFSLAACGIARKGEPNSKGGGGASLDARESGVSTPVPCDCGNLLPQSERLNYPRVEKSSNKSEQTTQCIYRANSPKSASAIVTVSDVTSENQFRDETGVAADEYLTITKSLQKQSDYGPVYGVRGKLTATHYGRTTIAYVASSRRLVRIREEEAIADSPALSPFTETSAPFLLVVMDSNSMACTSPKAAKGQ